MVLMGGCTGMLKNSSMVYIFLQSGNYLMNSLKSVGSALLKIKQLCSQN